MNAYAGDLWFATFHVWLGVLSADCCSFCCLKGSDYSFQELLSLLPDGFLFVFRWVQAECRNLGDTDNPEVGDLLRTAVRCLKERPVLFKYCAEEVAFSSGSVCCY